MSLRMTQDRTQAWSYGTCIRDVLPDGRTIGNMTRYSSTTTRHQGIVAAGACAVVVRDVPRGTRFLADWYWGRPDVAAARRLQEGLVYDPEDTA